MGGGGFVSNMCTKKHLHYVSLIVHVHVSGSKLEGGVWGGGGGEYRVSPKYAFKTFILHARPS